MTTREQIQVILSHEGAVDELYQIIHKLETKVANFEQENVNTLKGLQEI